MGRLETSFLGKAAILVGVALLMYAVCGFSALSYPQCTAYYAAGGSGIVAIFAGFLLGAIQFTDT